MRNVIGTRPTQLIPQITAAMPGVVTYGAVLGLAADLESVMAAKKAALLTADTAYEQAKIALKNAVKARKTAVSNACIHIRNVRELMKPSLTPRYSQAWDAFGFNGSLMIVRIPEKVLVVLSKMGGHLGANPELGAEEPHLEAAKTTAHETALITANATVNQWKAEVQRLLEERALKAEEVRTVLREILAVLHLKFSPDDSRWVEFGFNKPGAQPVPPMPEGVTAVLIGTNAISVKWPPTERAEYHRIWKRVIGVDVELVPVGNSSDGDFLIEDLPGNADVEVALSAANSGGESAKCPVILVRTL